MILSIDFETRSPVDIKECGAYVYGEHPETQILCCAYKVDDGETKIWKVQSQLDGKWLYDEKDFVEFFGLVWDADEVHAHNANFERIIWHNIIHKRWGFKDIPVEKWRCSAALAATYALPRSLGECCQALGLSVQKDMEGRRIMLKFCSPKKDGSYYWDDEEFVKLCDYCKKDVDAEHALIKALPPMPQREQLIWQLDQEINDRGVHVDLDSVNKLIAKVEAKRAALDKEVATLTGGKIESVRQLEATRGWLADKGAQFEDLRKQTVIDALKNNTLDPVAKRILEIRQASGLSSIDKLYAMKRATCADGRIKGLFMYHGASTGRWSGKLVQPQNFPRDCFSTREEIDWAANAGIEEIEAKYGCVLKTASRCLRGLLRPQDGYAYVGGDYAAIEARVTAWLADEEWVLQAFRDNKDLYKVAAMGIYNKPYEAIEKPERQMGKIAELALGYQGWVGAFSSMASIYGVVVEEEKAKEIILAWRESRPMTVRLWKGLETAAFKTVRTGEPQPYGKIKFYIQDKFLCMRLPSGRCLYYYDPHISERKSPYGISQVVGFWAVDSKTKKWSRQQTYGGMLTENAVQAVARDILADALLRVDTFEYPVAMHIHDEMHSEVKKSPVHKRDFASPIINTGQQMGDRLQEFKSLMTTLPPWGEGIPLGAECEVSDMYKKE